MDVSMNKPRSTALIIGDLYKAGGRNRRLHVEAVNRMQMLEKEVEKYKRLSEQLQAELTKGKHDH